MLIKPPGLGSPADLSKLSPQTSLTNGQNPKASRLVLEVVAQNGVDLWVDLAGSKAKLTAAIPWPPTKQLTVIAQNPAAVGPSLNQPNGPNIAAAATAMSQMTKSPLTVTDIDGARLNPHMIATLTLPERPSVAFVPKSIQSDAMARIEGDPRVANIRVEIKALMPAQSALEPVPTNAAQRQSPNPAPVSVGNTANSVPVANIGTNPMGGTGGTMVNVGASGVSRNLVTTGMALTTEANALAGRGGVGKDAAGPAMAGGSSGIAASGIGAAGNVAANSVKPLAATIMSAGGAVAQGTGAGTQAVETGETIITRPPVGQPDARETNVGSKVFNMSAAQPHSVTVATGEPGPPSPPASPNSRSAVESPVMKTPLASTAIAPTKDGLAMTVSNQNGLGHVTLKSGLLSMTPEQPLAGLVPGDQIGVRLLAPLTPLGVPTADTLEQVVRQLLGAQETQATELTKSIKDLQQLTPALWRLMMNKGGEPIQDLTIDQLTNQAMPAKERHALTKSTMEGPAAAVTAHHLGDSAPARAIEPQLPNWIRSIQWEEQAEDNERDRPNEAETKSCKLTLEFSALGRVSIGLAVSPKRMNATIDCAGVMDHRLRTEIADVFGAGAEMANRSGQLVMRFSRPSSTQV